MGCFVGRTSRGPTVARTVSVAVLALCLALAVARPACGSPAEAGRPSLSGTTGLLRVGYADVQTRGVLALSLTAHYYESSDLSGELGATGDGRYTSLHLGGNYGLTSWLELGLDVPFRRATWDTPEGDVKGEVLDAPVFAAKVGLPLEGVLRVGVEGRVRLPLEPELNVARSGGEDIFVTGGTATDWQAVLMATLDLTDTFPLRAHANVGWAANTEDRGRRFYPDHYPAGDDGASSSDALILRGAIEFPGRNVDLFTEFVGDISERDDVIAPKENPLTLTPGVRVRLGSLSATVGLAVGLSGNEADTPDFDPHEAFPDWELTLSLGYAWPVTAADTDGDGIPDYRDACRMRSEDLDGYEDDDGCPDPDNDGDGIPDASDLAPDLGEDLDGFQDDDGVPDLDNDGDGIIDSRDMCPDEREDLDGFEDEDGCPDN